jgi:glyoxylase-like metal-dependent hydrolase (beta-lactamase superfamily II)
MGPLRIHHLNCGTFCPVGGRLMDGISRGVTGRLVCHCLLIEGESGLVLVDTGLGMRDVREPFPRLSRLYANLLNIQLDPERTALRQIERLGFRPEDVRHIVLTHLDFDHAGGLEDFPQAKVHLMAAEAEAAGQRDGFVARRRYRPQQWGDTTRWKRYQPGGEPWLGFSAVRDLEGLPPEILLVPLVGHSLGHAGVAVRGEGGWLLLAGDAYFHHGEVGGEAYACPPGLQAYQKLMEADATARLHNQARLRELAREHGREVRIVCSHDPVELDRMAAAAPVGEVRTADVPAAAPTT